MKKEEIKLWDWERILIGNAPLEFMAEVLVRTVLIYIILLVAMRLFGKRMNANISIFELAIMMTLGAIVSVPMQVPDKGLVQGIVLLLCGVLALRGLGWLTYKSKKIDVLTQGDVSLLVKNGVIDVLELKKSVLSHEQLFSQLRSQGVRHLGQAKRVYLEACGKLSIFKYEQPKPGLSILPARDEGVYRTEERADNFWACKNCGYVIEAKTNNQKACSSCHASDWDKAVNENVEKFEAAEKYA